MAGIKSGRIRCYDTDSEDYYEDVGPNNPYYIYIQTLTTEGIVQGVGDGTDFKPTLDLNRIQLSKIIYETFVRESWWSPSENWTQNNYSDITDSNQWYYDYVLALSEKTS